MLNLLVYWALPHDNGFRRCPNGAVLATRLRGSRYASRDFRRYKPRLFRLSRSPLAYSRFRPLWMLVTLLMRRAAHAPVPLSSPREPRPAHRSAPDVHPCVVGGHRDSTVSRLATPAKTDAVMLKMHEWAHARRRAMLAVAVAGIFPVTGHRHGQHVSPKRPSAALDRRQSSAATGQQIGASRAGFPLSVVPCRPGILLANALRRESN